MVPRGLRTPLPLASRCGAFRGRKGRCAGGVPGLGARSRSSRALPFAEPRTPPSPKAALTPAEPRLQPCCRTPPAPSPRDAPALGGAAASHPPPPPGGRLLPSPGRGGAVRGRAAELSPVAEGGRLPPSSSPSPSPPPPPPAPRPVTRLCLPRAAAAAGRCRAAPCGDYEAPWCGVTVASRCC